MKVPASVKSLVPYLLAVIGFIIVGYAYAPYTLGGKVVNQSDISSWQGMSREIVEWNEQHPDDQTYWTNSMFGGMPANTISVKYKGDLTQYIYDLFFIGQRPASYLIISMLGAFLLFLAFGVDFWLAVLGAIAVSFCSYNMQIIQVGHNTKMIAIAFMPWVLAALVYAYRKRWLLGSLLFGLALSFQIKANHPQITYYLAIVVLGFVVWQFVDSLRQRKFVKFLRTSVAVLIAGLLGIACNINHLWPTYEYGKISTRGGSELVAEASDADRENSSAVSAGGGLDIEYATQWSYGIEETPNLFIPNFNGGASNGSLSKLSQTYSVLSRSYAGADEIIEQLPLYWGPQPFTAGPMYMGIVSVFLFVLGLFVVRGGAKWWLLAVSLIALVLSFGYHFIAPTRFFFEHVPMYNKFRTVSMILVVLQITIPVLGILALNQIFGSASQDANISKSKEYPGGKQLLIASGITGGICLLFALIPSLAGSFIGASDSMLPKDISEAIVADRASLLSADAFRSFVFVLLAAIAIWLGIKKKLAVRYLYFVLILLVFIDLWGIDKRYLNSSHFVTERDFKAPLQKRAIDDYILSSDNDLSYRVLDLSTDPFNNAYPSYWHKTIGGYSPAKVQRYQDLIERAISKECNEIISDLNASGATTIEEANAALGNYNILNMLNMRYVILGAEQPPLTNGRALGNCWFADSVVSAIGANDEMDKLLGADVSHIAVVEDSIGDIENVEKDESASIELISYAPNRLRYSYTSNTPQFALFSEVYTSDWVAKFTGTLDGRKVDGEPIDVKRANYILRALELPAGEGEIEFCYLPESMVRGAGYSRLASSVLLLLLVLSIVFCNRPRNGN